MPQAAALRAAARRVLGAVPVAVWRRLQPKTAIALCYHMVADARLPHLKHYPVLTPAELEADLVHLRREFGTISYAQLARRRGAAAVARDNAAIVTFDDGFAECATLAAPIMLRHGVGGTFFVITDLVDNVASFRESTASLCIDAILRLPPARVGAMVRELGLAARLRPPPPRIPFDPPSRPLDRADFGTAVDPALHPLLHWLLTIPPGEVALMAPLCSRLGVDPPGYVQRVRPYLTSRQICWLHAQGFTIGAHSRSHPRLQDLSPAEAEREIVDSCRIVRHLTGQASVPFAFPYSGAGIDRAWLAHLRQRHDFIGLFFDTGGLSNDAPFVVQRVFAERFGPDRDLDAILRHAWARRTAWGW